MSSGDIHFSCYFHLCILLPQLQHVRQHKQFVVKENLNYNENEEGE